MGDRRRVLIVATHPVQYLAPIFRQMAQHPEVDIHVAYCSLFGAEAGFDPEFGVEVKWDVPLLEGYAWACVPNKSPWSGLGRFFGLINPGLWKLIASGGFEAVVVFAGYNYFSFWIALAATKLHRRALIFGTDAHELGTLGGSKWKVHVKRVVWPRLFRLADVTMVTSSGGTALMTSLGIPAERQGLVPNVVDNGWWLEQAAQVDRDAVRRAWGIPENAPVALFCGKLLSRKRPSDLLHAFAKVGVLESHLVFAGAGPLRRELESATKSLGLAHRVHFLGFINQSQMPSVYCASDLLVLPSEYEAFGLVVNEAFLCSCPALVSDHVGARLDLISPGRNGDVFPCGDVNGLTAMLSEYLADRDRLRRMGQASRDRMQTWSPRERVEGMIQAIEKAIARVRRVSAT